MRIDQRGNAHYSSFQELASAYNIKPVSRVTKDKEKLKSQQNKFQSRHRCRACGEPMSWIGDNIMTCCNPKCKGIKIKHKNEDGTESVGYITSYDLLDTEGADIAGVIFSEEV